MFRYVKRLEDLFGRNGERKGKKREIRQKKSIYILEVDDKKFNQVLLKFEENIEKNKQKNSFFVL